MKDLVSWLFISTVFAGRQGLVSSNNIEKGRRFEMEICEEIIPQFIDHIAEHGDDAECGEVGQFPKPGDCTVFFKCVRGRGRILPILEYCAIGFNFDGSSCVRSSDLNDCPQFKCKTDNNNTLNISTESSQNNTQIAPEMIDSQSLEDMPMGIIASSAAQQAMEIENSKNKVGRLQTINTIILFLQTLLSARFFI